MYINIDVERVKLRMSLDELAYIINLIHIKTK